MIDALIFAAGFGTRLRPVTDSVPKALVTVGGMTVLERAIRRIVELAPGVIVVNAHHHAGQVEAEMARLNRLLEAEAESEGEPKPPRIVVSLEAERPLETGGGLRHAVPLLGAGRPVLLHNADVVTELSLSALVAAHGESPRLATLAVQDRASSRKLLFDPEGLYGRLHVGSGREERAREPGGPRRALAFSGVHVVSPGLIEQLPDEEVFSITDHYLAVAASGARIEAFDIGAAAWWEIGTPERLAAARRAFTGSCNGSESSDHSSVGEAD
ncbi:MAG: NTP transferase domain-containing protein [marine benthic group bacterium]|nr:NTP transferase domain-containing protein [Gemmatimonadota bacterium]